MLGVVSFTPISGDGKEHSSADPGTTLTVVKCDPFCIYGHLEKVQECQVFSLN